MSKKLLQYYRSQMDVGGKVLPKYQSLGLFDPRQRAISESTSNPNLIRNVQANIALQAQRANQRLQEAREKQGTIRQARPKQSVISKALSIAANPMTAASYVVKGQPIPENFDKVSTNIYDIGTSIINPINAAYDLSNSYSDIKRGDYGSAALNLVSGATSLPSVPAWSKKIAPKFSYATSLSAARGDVSTLAEITALTAANAVAPILSKNPLTKNLYKAAAYRVGKYSGGEPGANLKERVKGILSQNKPSSRSYTGANFQTYTNDLSNKANDRDLLRQYIYGDSPGFEKSELIPRGLEKYYDKYGDMSVFKLRSSIPENQLVEVPRDRHYATLLNRSVENAGGASIVNKRGSIGVPVSEAMNSPVQPLDDISGHMTFVDRKGPNQFNLTTQDIWKFTPEDYARRYGSVNQNGLMEPKTYATYLKAKLMERAGNPFVLMQENPMKFIRPSYKEKVNLGNDFDVDEFGISQEDIENSLKEMKLINKQQGGPIVSTQGYKQGPPPQGSFYRIPSDTLYNPTPYRIKAVANTGQIQYLNPFDESNVNFPGADYIDEFPIMRQGGSLNRTVTCSSCGWSWKFSDGGKDPVTCHKCGGQIKMKNGGQHGGLDRWFAEKWVDVKTGKACGRQEGESRAGYPACRPSKRVSSKTPKTSSEMSSAEKAKFKQSKTSSKRIPYNHKRK